MSGRAAFDIGIFAHNHLPVTFFIWSLNVEHHVTKNENDIAGHYHIRLGNRHATAIRCTNCQSNYLFE